MEVKEMATTEIEKIAGPEPKVNFKATAGALGIPVGVKVAESLGIIPPQPGQTYTLLTSVSAFIGLGIDTVNIVRKDVLRIDKIINAALEKKRGGMENG